MAVLQIAADRPGAGKTSLSGALALQLASSSKRAAYYKPFSADAERDHDSLFMSGLLSPASGDPSYPPRLLPSTTGVSSPLESTVLQEIQTRIGRMNGQSDTVLVESPDLGSIEGTPSTLTLELSSALDSRVLLVFQFSKETTAPTIVQACHPFADRLVGIILNGIPAYRSQEATTGLASQLRAQGLPLLAALGEDRTMLGTSVQLINDHLGGTWVQEPENVDAPVERFLIGGNILDEGPTYFGRYSNQAIITRGARPDIQMAALMSGVQCLVLTGGDEPAEYIKAEASTKGVPLLLVELNTAETANALGSLLDHTTCHSLRKIERFRYLLQETDAMAALESIAIG